MKKTLKMTFEEFRHCMEEEWGLNCYEKSDGMIELHKMTDAGEDYCFAVNKSTLVDDFIESAYYFDVSEHVELCLDERSRVTDVPDIATLVDDARAIERMLKDVAIELALDKVEIVD